MDELSEYGYLDRNKGKKHSTCWCTLAMSATNDLPQAIAEQVGRRSHGCMRQQETPVTKAVEVAPVPAKFRPGRPRKNPIAEGPGLPSRAEGSASRPRSAKAKLADLNPLDHQ